MYYDIESLHIDPSEVLAYLRKSRSDEPHLTVEEVLEKHERILSDIAKKFFGGPIPEENIYREVVSGESLDSRPEILKILKKIESPKYKYILTVEPQRLSRGDLEDCGRLIKLLRYTNTKVITQDRIYDLTNEDDRDRFERELKKGNEYLEYYKKIQNRGKIASVQEGNYIGSVPPYGYKKITIREGRKKMPTLEIVPEEAEVVRMIYDMFANQRIGVVVIAHTLDKMGIKAPKGEHWSHNAIRDMLRNIHYIGKVKWNWRKEVRVVKDQEVIVTRPKQEEFLVFDGKHEAIIDEALFYKAQRLIGQTPKKRLDREMKNPLSGLLFCTCGKAYVMRHYRDKNGKVRCQPRLLCNNQIYCNSGSVLASEVLEAVAKTLEEQIEDFRTSMSSSDAMDQLRKETNISIMENRLSELEAKEVSLWEKYSEEGMPKAVFEKLRTKVTQEISNVTSALEEEKKNIDCAIDYADKIVTFSQALDALKDDSVSIEAKNSFLKCVIERVTITKGRPVRVGAYNQWDDPGFKLDIKLRI
jgi:hypothetical protein